MPWPIRKVPLKKAVRHIRYHPTSQTYVIITSVPDAFIVKDENNQAVHESGAPAASAGTDANGTAVAATTAAAATATASATDASKAADAPAGTDANGTAAASTTIPNGQPKPLKSTFHLPGFLPSSERQTVELVSPVTWETVDRYELQEYEIVTSMETVSLESSQDRSGRKQFIAVGTSFIKGEDSTMRGTVRKLI